MGVIAVHILILTSFLKFTNSINPFISFSANDF